VSSMKYPRLITQDSDGALGIAVIIAISPAENGGKK
jgi:hypothetical protein